MGGFWVPLLGEEAAQHTHCTFALTDLPFRLLSSPAGGLFGPAGEVGIVADFLDHPRKPLVAIVGGNFAVREGIGKVTGQVSTCNCSKDSLLTQ